MKGPARISIGDVRSGVFPFDPMGMLEHRAGRSDGVAPVIPSILRPSKQLYVVSNPAILDKIINDKTGTFDRSGVIYKILTQSYLPGDTGGVLAGGLFAQDSADIWRRERTACNPYFTPNALKDIASHTITFLNKYMKSWPLKTDIDVLEPFRKTSLDLLTLHLFGTTVDPGITKRIAEIAPKYFEKMAKQLGLGMLPTRRLTGWSEYERLGTEFIGLVDKVIDAALQNPTRFKDTLLGSLLRKFAIQSGGTYILEKENRRLVIGTVGTMYLAGFDSTAVVATHACLELAQNSELLILLRSEIKQVFRGGRIIPEKLGELKLLQAFWQLTLHRHPAFRFIFRNVAKPCKVGEFQLQPEDQLLLALKAAHEFPGNEMTLEDFMSQPSKRVHMGHMPYGQRQCPGTPIANIQGPAMIAGVIKNHLLAPGHSRGNRVKIGMTSPPISKIHILRVS